MAETGSGAPAVDAAIKWYTDWRSETLARIRALIMEADPGVIEDVKWRKPSNEMRGVPVWENDGLICTGETYKAVVKLTFARGAASTTRPSCSMQPGRRHAAGDRHARG